MLKTARQQKALLLTFTLIIAASLILSNLLTLSTPTVAAAEGSAFTLKGASVSANCFVPTAHSYYPNAWQLLKAAGVNWVRVSGGTEGDVNHFNIKNYPNEWAQNLDSFLAQAASYGIKVSFGSLGNPHDTLFGIRSPGTSDQSDPNAEFTSISDAKAMIDQLAGNNNLHHNFITDSRVLGWVTSNEVYIGPSTSSNPNSDGPFILDWNLQLLDYIRSLGGKAWIASPTVVDGSSDGYDFAQVAPLLTGHVDYLEAHYYKEWELVTYYSNGDGTYDWTGFQAFYETLLMETMVTVRGSFPLENVLLGEFGMWLGSGSDVGVTHSFTNQDRQNYYHAVLSAAKAAGLLNVCQHDFFEQANIGVNDYAIVNLNSKDFFTSDAADAILPAYGSTSISIVASSTNVPINSAVIFSGTVTPLKSGATITFAVQYQEGSWSNLSSVTTNSESQFSYTWTCTTAGTYTVKATWGGDAVAAAGESNSIAVTVESLHRSITLNVFPSEVSEGNSVTLSGYVSPPQSSLYITLYYATVSGGWNFLEQTQSNSAGYFVYYWNATNAGSYQVKAVASGDSNADVAESGIFQVSVTQTSTIPELPLNSPFVAVLVVALILVTLIASVNFYSKARTKPAGVPMKNRLELFSLFPQVHAKKNLHAL